MVWGDKKEALVKLFSFSITFLIITLLILSGPAQAFVISLDIPDNIINKGELINFTGDIEINSDENLPIENVLLTLNGSETVNCLFYPNATIISGCKGIAIEFLQNASYEYGNGYGYYGYGYDFGYGYGFTNGILSYNFTLNTTDYLFGNYTTELTAYIDSREFSEKGDNIMIVESISITNLPASPGCAYETDNITLSANITGSIVEVWVETNISNNLTNYSTSNLDSVYSSIVNGIGGQDLQWRFAVKDISNNIIYGDWNSMYIVRKTSLTVNPLAPNGLKGWYTVEPTWTLSNPDANIIWYRWNGDPRIEYSGPFGLEDISNAPPIESAGTLKLTYFANTSCGIESWNEDMFYVDLINPEITELVPENNSDVNSLRPSISAYLDEVYQSNSGIDESSIIMKLDNVEVIPIITSYNDLDRLLVYIPPTDLSLGWHEVYVYAKDTAGRSNETSWRFNINITSIINLTVYSPFNNEVYDSKRILFNITTDKEVEEIGYINYNDTNPRERRLCRNCDEYGFNREKTKSLNEGENNIKIMARDEYGFTHEKAINLFIDSKKPRISKTEPRRGFANGDFSVEFKELNPISLILNYGINGDMRNNEVDLNNCSKDEDDYKCLINVNLSDFDGQEIEYWFNLTDIAGNYDESRKEDLKVDFSDPVINNVKYEMDGRRVKFIINVTESYLEEVGYSYYVNGNLKDRRLCRDLENGICEKKISLKDGWKNLTIYALDELGNSDFENISILIDSKKPRIRKTEPRKGFANGDFNIEFEEQNPVSVVLNYGVFADRRDEILDLGDCSKDEDDYECLINVNLSDFDGQEIEYWFEVEDILGQTDESRERELKVDITAPELEVYMPEDLIYGRRVQFNMSVSEDVKLEYTDKNDLNERWRRLCSNCDDYGFDRKKTKTFKKGVYDLLIRAVDDAGNSDEFEVEFWVDY